MFTHILLQKKQHVLRLLLDGIIKPSFHLTSKLESTCPLLGSCFGHLFFTNWWFPQVLIFIHKGPGNFSRCIFKIKPECSFLLLCPPLFGRLQIVKAINCIRLKYTIILNESSFHGIQNRIYNRLKKSLPHRCTGIRNWFIPASCFQVSLHLNLRTESLACTWLYVVLQKTQFMINRPHISSAGTFHFLNILYINIISVELELAWPLRLWITILAYRFIREKNCYNRVF